MLLTGSTAAATTPADSELGQFSSACCSSPVRAASAGVGALSQRVTATFFRAQIALPWTTALPAAMRCTNRPSALNSKMRMSLSTESADAEPTLIE